MHPDQYRLVACHRTLHQSQMQIVVDAVLVGIQTKLPNSVGKSHSLIRSRVFRSESGNESGRQWCRSSNRAGGRKPQVGISGHAIFVEDFHDHRCRLQPCQPCQVASRLGMTCPLQHPAGLGHQWKHVSRLHQIFRLRRTRRRAFDGSGPVAAEMPVVTPLAASMEMVKLVEWAVVLIDHQGQAQLLAAFRRQGGQINPCRSAP